MHAGSFGAKRLQRIAREQRQHEQQPDGGAEEQDLHRGQFVAQIFHDGCHHDERQRACRDQRGRARHIAGLERGFRRRGLRPSHCVRRCICATAPDMPRLAPMMMKMPATPEAAAITPAMKGMTNCPIRLPIMRSELAVPRVSSLVIASSVAMLTVMALLSAKPAAATISTISGIGSGNAMAA